MPDRPCANLSTEQTQRVQHTLPLSTVSALLLLPSSHKLTQEREPTQSRQHTNMCAFHSWGQVELTSRAEEACTTAAQASVSGANRLQFTRLRGLRFTMPRLGRNAHKDTAGQRVFRFERFYAGVSHSHKTFGSLCTSQKAGSARTSGQSNNTRGLRSDPVQSCGPLVEADAAIFVQTINQQHSKLQKKE